MLKRRSTVVAVLMSVAFGMPLEGNIVYLDPEKSAVDEIVQSIRESDAPRAALEALQAVVRDSEKKLKTRRYGLAKLSELVLEFRWYEVNDFFLEIARTQHASDPGRQLPADAFLESSKIQVYQEDDVETQNRVLAGLLKATFEGRLMTHVRRWSANELCSRGVDQHLDEIHQVFELSRSSTRDEELELCRTKIERVRSQADRTAVLEEALRWSAPIARLDEFHRWAIAELIKIPGDRTEQILLQYAVEKATSQEVRDRPKLLAALGGLIQRGWSASRLIDAGLSPWIVHSAGAPPG